MDRTPRTASRSDELGRLYQDEGSRLWRAVFAYGGDAEVASDAVAEAFAQCIRRGDEVRDPRAWVWRSAFRIAAGELKERGRQQELGTEDRPHEIPEEVGDLMNADRRSCLASNAPPSCSVTTRATTPVRSPGSSGRARRRSECI